MTSSERGNPAIWKYGVGFRQDLPISELGFNLGGTVAQPLPPQLPTRDSWIREEPDGTERVLADFHCLSHHRPVYHVLLSYSSTVSVHDLHQSRSNPRHTAPSCNSRLPDSLPNPRTSLRRTRREEGEIVGGEDKIPKTARRHRRSQTRLPTKSYPTFDRSRTQVQDHHMITIHSHIQFSSAIHSGRLHYCA
jgi:hypothetical protein